MEQVKTFYRRYRWLFLAAAYLVVFAVGVLYLRVTISIPPEGDDKLTLNRWMYDFQRMPFWQYLLQDLQGRLRYFTLQEVRFFPYHYPNAVALLFYGSLSHYRLYIIAWTGAAAFLVSRVAARFGSGDALALGGFTLAMAAAPIWNEGMYSYYAVPQRALFWAMAAWLCLFGWENSHRRGWAAAAALLSFFACGTYEIGYMFAALAFVVWCLRARSVKAGLFNTAPALGGMGVALIFHMLCGRSGGTGNEVSLDIPQVLRVLVQQMAASIPGLNSRILQEDCGVLSNGDRLWPLVLGVLAGLLLFFAVPREKLNRKMLGAAAGFGLAVWALPALLLALSARYQAPGAITWKWGYIPAAASSIGFALVVAVLLAALAGACRKLPQILSILARLGLTAALAAVPSPEALRAAEESGFVHEEEALTQALLYRLRTASPAELAALYGMDEGLENRFIAAAQTCSTRETLLDCIKTRRYTRARLSRLCAYALLNLTRDFAQTHRAPDYARVLGFRKSAAPLLKTIKQRSSIPLITKAANFGRSNPLFALDVLAQDLWSLGVSNPSLRASGRDFTTSPAILSR